jgi:co-chaperonin GroES (HSP10)|tara:strand:+ start:560 stop:838 length:279 start_codon:yes stop_codon:yes gene_type:complete
MFKPVNRYVLVEDITKKKEQETPMGILLPDDYKPTEERYVSLRVIDHADDIRFQLSTGSIIIVDRKMIEQITVDNGKYSIVQDNYIVGIVNV